MKFSGRLLLHLVFLVGSISVSLCAVSTQEIHVREKRKTIAFDTYSHRQWPTTIAYRLHTSITGPEKASIVDVLKEDFEANTCLRFTENVNDTQQFILFRHSDGRTGECKAYIGMEQDVRTTHFQGQPIYLDSHCMILRGSLLYLIASTLGMYGEARRPDRDDYIDINYDNMVPGGLHWFEKKDERAVNTHGVPYDYGSVMHPGPRVWLKPELYNDSLANVVVPKDPAFLHTMGQQSELSFYDIMALNKAYCADTCAEQSAGHVIRPPLCENGGYQDPNDCSKCKCPDGYGGNFCDDVTSGSDACTPSSGHIQAAEETQCVTSPGYMDRMPYDTGDHCAWRIQAPSSDRRVQLWFHTYFVLPHVDITSAQACLHWVEIQQRGLHDHRGPRYCGFVEEDTHPTTACPLISNSDDLLIIFKSPNASIHAHFKFPNASRIGFKLCFNTTFQRETNPISPDEPVSEKSTASVASATFVLIVAVGAVFVIFLVAILIFCLCCKKRKQIQAGSMENVVVTHRNGEVSISPVYTISDQSSRASGTTLPHGVSGTTFSNALYERMSEPESPNDKPLGDEHTQVAAARMQVLEKDVQVLGPDMRVLGPDVQVLGANAHALDSEPPRYEEHVPPLHRSLPEDYPPAPTYGDESEADGMVGEKK